MASIIRPDIEVLDNGAPIFYCPYWPTATPCGHGNLMFAGCILTGSFYVPQCFIVTPVHHVMENARRSMHAAADALNEMQLAGMPLREVLRN